MQSLSSLASVKFDYQDLSQISLAQFVSFVFFPKDIFLVFMVKTYLGIWRLKSLFELLVGALDTTRRLVVFGLDCFRSGLCYIHETGGLAVFHN